MVSLTGTKYLFFPNGIFSLFTYWNIIVHKDIQRQFYRLLGKSPQTSRVLGNKQGEQKFSCVMVRPCPPSFVYSFPNKDPFYTKETHALFRNTSCKMIFLHFLHFQITHPISLIFLHTARMALMLTSDCFLEHSIVLPSSKVVTVREFLQFTILRNAISTAISLKIVTQHF